MATGQDTSTDCLFSSRSLRTVRVANKSEGQRLATILQSLDSEMQLNMMHINLRAKKTNLKLAKLRKEIREKTENKPEATPPPTDQDDYEANADYLLREDNDPTASIKQLITYAVEQFELRKEESQTVSAPDDLSQVFPKDEQLNQSDELVSVACTEEPDKTQSNGMNDATAEDNALANQEIMTVQELKALVVQMYGSEDSEFDVDSVVECLLPILRKTEVKTKDAELSKSSDKLMLLKQILTSEFPETYVRHEQAALEAKYREKKLWKKFNSCKLQILPPIHQHKTTKPEARNWDLDTPTQVPAQVKEEEWEDLKYCHYLRPPITKT